MTSRGDTPHLVGHQGRRNGKAQAEAPVLVGGAGQPFTIWSDIGAGANVLDLQHAIDAGAKRINLHSPGGDHATAAGLATLIAEHGLAVHCHAAESAAVLVLAAGKNRTLAANGWLGLHRVWTAVAGGSDELAAAAEHCRRLDDLYAQALERWSRWPAEQWLEAMRAGRVLDPEQALAAGLIDEIGPESDRLAERPERIEDGRPRAVATLEEAARLAELAAAWEEHGQRKDAAHEHAPEVLASHTGRPINYLQAFTPPERLASIWQAAAAHTRRNSAPWSARWICPDCGSLNHSPPALGIRPTVCRHCNSNHEEKTP